MAALRNGDGLVQDRVQDRDLSFQIADAGLMRFWRESVAWLRCFQRCKHICPRSAIGLQTLKV